MPVALPRAIPSTVSMGDKEGKSGLPEAFWQCWPPTSRWCCKPCCVCPVDISRNFGIRLTSVKSYILTNLNIYMFVCLTNRRVCWPSLLWKCVSSQKTTMLPWAKTSSWDWSALIILRQFWNVLCKADTSWWYFNSRVAMLSSERTLFSSGEQREAEVRDTLQCRKFDW